MSRWDPTPEAVCRKWNGSACDFPRCLRHPETYRAMKDDELDRVILLTGCAHEAVDAEAEADRRAA